MSPPAGRDRAWRWLVILLLFLPLARLVWLGVSQDLGANPVEFLLKESGEVAVRLLILSLWVSPLKVIFPRWSWAKKLTPYRKILGLAAFFYALGHVSLFLADKLVFPEELWLELAKAFILTGLGAFVILLSLALTSNRWSQKRLGGKGWKNLHRLVYLALILAFVHMTFKDKGPVALALGWFAPLALAQAWRLLLFWRRG